ncbi:MAG: Crp/Fnr family transcriptional regulator [Vicingus serpentipes]|nr:Crp/Fnr family transcriptional regulator [Vicingus serpentipes]
MLKSNARDANCESCQTSGCFIKQHCADKYITLLNNLKETSTYRKDQYIAFEGYPVLGLFFIQSGKAKVVSSGLNGKTQVVRLTKSGDIIGHRGYGGEKYPISAVAIEESIVCFVDNDTIHQAFMDNPRLTFELMMYYSRELRKSEAKIKNQAQMNVREKVADALISCNSFFNNKNDSSFLIQLNRQDIADLAGINTEQLSRILSEFKKDEIITISKDGISINDLSFFQKIVSPFGSVE